jgi:hypothetical protein
MEIQIPGFKLPAMIDITAGRRFGAMVTIHSRTNVYDGKSAQRVMDLVNKTDSEKASAALAAIGGDCSKAVVIRLQLQSPPNQEQAIQLKSLLTANPGKNVVVLSYSGEGGIQQTIPVAKFPTSLALKDADKFSIILPCQVIAENADDHLGFMADAMETVS